ncbi:MAG: hypothetical protein HY996_01645 [Micrococcales bacterium]|nr:hypothetical protein [Micrococcales bacterium]
MRARTSFDDLALGPEGAKLVRADSERFTVFEYDVIDQFFDTSIDTPLGDIDLPIGGGFRLDLEGFFEARYQTTEIRIVEAAAALTTAGSVATVDAPYEDGWGSALDLHVEPRGEFECEVGLTLLPTLYVEVAGESLDFSIPVDLQLDADSGAAAFASASARLGLPDARVSAAALDLSDSGRGTLRIDNDGEATLSVRLSASDPTIELGRSAVEIAPGASEQIGVEIVGEPPDPARAGVFLQTNDPDAPHLAVGVLGEPVDPGLDPDRPDRGDDPDADRTGSDPDDPAGGSPVDRDGLAGPPGLEGGCRVVPRGPAGARSLLVALLGVALLLARRPRR